jgi:hypothetical protein
MNFSHLAIKLRYKVTKFSGILSQGIDKTARRFPGKLIDPLKHHDPQPSFGFGKKMGYVQY